MIALVRKVRSEFSHGFVARFRQRSLTIRNHAFAHKRSTLTSVLDRLDSRGFITRQPSSEDRRSFVVSLTRRGQVKAAKVHWLIESLEAGALRESGRGELDAFSRLIRRLEQKAAEDDSS